MIQSYCMPPEWAPHEATWLAWPHNQEHWPGNFAPIPAVFARIVHALLEGGENVFLCVNDEAMEEAARAALRIESQNLRFFRIPTDSSWMRDIGPIFVRGETLTLTDWIFNAWGGKYPPWDNDNAVPALIAKTLALPSVQPGIVLEGGSIDVNGAGSLLTTEQCLLNKNRNPHLSRVEIEKYLKDFLGATNILWLKEGIVGDDTDGHIDDIARFTDAHTIVACVEENRNDENYEILRRNFEDLKNMCDQESKPFRIVALPMPDSVVYEGQRLPASYANFYIANRAVLVPTFRCEKDAAAMKILGELFPGRAIIGIGCTDLVWGLGAIHCSTQQQPISMAENSGTPN